MSVRRLSDPGDGICYRLVEDIRDTTARRLLSVVPQEKIVRVQTANPIVAGAPTSQAKGERKTSVNGVEIGRNSPCPCGSGKRYKRCCGAKEEK